MARSAAGVVRVAAIPILAWLFQDCSNHPAAACGCGYPSLSKEGSLLAKFRDRNKTTGIGQALSLFLIVGG